MDISPITNHYSIVQFLTHYNPTIKPLFIPQNLCDRKLKTSVADKALDLLVLDLGLSQDWENYELLGKKEPFTGLPVNC